LRGIAEDGVTGIVDTKHGMTAGAKGETSPSFKSSYKERVLKKTAHKMIKGFDKFYSVMYNTIQTIDIVLSIMYD
jgi:hypothetical protein